MPGGQWKGSTRRETLDREFFRNRAAILRDSGYQCAIRTPGICIGHANQADHIGNRLDHSRENLRPACEPCHRHRSSQQGGQAIGRKKAAQRAARKRPAERHPGALG